MGHRHMRALGETTEGLTLQRAERKPTQRALRGASGCDSLGGAAQKQGFQ